MKVDAIEFKLEHPSKKVPFVKALEVIGPTANRTSNSETHIAPKRKESKDIQP
jgi:hypothetical protein